MSTLVGIKIKEIREAEGLSRPQLSEMTGILPDTIKKIESHKIKSVGFESLEKITTHPDLQKYTLWLMTGTTVPEMGQIAPGETVKTGGSVGIPANLLNNAFERTVTTSIALGWLNAKEGINFSMLADLFRHDFVEVGGVLIEPVSAADESQAG